jgi:hypothetical protein
MERRGEKKVQKKIKKITIALIAVIGLTGVTFLGANSGFAHCDGLDRPVVKAAQKALDKET